jgi:hypothetical protein
METAQEKIVNFYLTEPELIEFLTSNKLVQSSLGHLDQNGEWTFEVIYNNVTEHDFVLRFHSEK